MSLITYKNANLPFLCTQAQADMLDRLAALNKGGIGSVKGYRPDGAKFVGGAAPKWDLQIITRFDTSKLYARKIKALESITFAECATDIAKHDALSKMTSGDCLALFNTRRDGAIASMKATLEGDRSGAHREAHDRNYIHIAEGVKVNLVSEKVDGVQKPVLTNGLPTLASILLPYLELKKTVVEPAEYKTVKSGAPVLMTNIIESKMNNRSVGYKMLSLKADNFDALNVGKQSIVADDLKNVDVSMSKSKLVALLEACGFTGDALALMEALEGDKA